LASWLQDGDVQQFLQVNRYQGALWFNKESFERLAWWMMWLVVVITSADPDRLANQAIEQISDSYQVIRRLLQAEQASEYQIEKLLAVLEA
jgi:hypothetical protein